MKPDVRRRLLLDMLQQADQPVTGSYLAEHLGVSRQVIVQDVALLRAKGCRLLATPQGYIMERPSSPRLARTFATRHTRTSDDITRELNAIVDHGGTVLDVVVEHPLYGDLRGLLMLRSRYDVKKFVERLEASGAEPLLVLTEGIHLHTVEAADEADFQHIEKALADLGFLLE